MRTDDAYMRIMTDAGIGQETVQTDIDRQKSIILATFASALFSSAMSNAVSQGQFFNNSDCERLIQQMTHLMDNDDSFNSQLLRDTLDWHPVKLNSTRGGPKMLLMYMQCRTSPEEEGFGYWERVLGRPGYRQHLKYVSVATALLPTDHGQWFYTMEDTDFGPRRVWRSGANGHPMHKGHTNSHKAVMALVLATPKKNAEGRFCPTSDMNMDISILRIQQPTGANKVALDLISLFSNTESESLLGVNVTEIWDKICSSQRTGEHMATTVLHPMSAAKIKYVVRNPKLANDFARTDDGNREMFIERLPNALILDEGQIGTERSAYNMDLVVGYDHMTIHGQSTWTSILRIILDALPGHFITRCIELAEDKLECTPGQTRPQSGGASCPPTAIPAHGHSARSSGSGSARLDGFQHSTPSSGWTVERGGAAPSSSSTSSWHRSYPMTGDVLYER
jgi:hypothetical protein